jgi:hypothetical protein
MKENCSVKIPVKLNCWKHHLKFIKQQLSGLKEDDDPDKLRKPLLLIGASQMDLYYGEYTPLQISDLVISELNSKNIFDYLTYKIWLKKAGSEYRLITLPDNSIWTLRLGNESQRYVHVHPGRYSEHTRRVKATTLKTAICIFAWKNIFPNIVVDLSVVNKIRKELVYAPPLKSMEHNAGLNKLIDLFNSVC